MTNFEIARRFAGLSPAALAERLSVSRTQIANWDSGFRTPSRANAQEIAAALDVSPAWLLGAPERLALHDPVEHCDYACPILRAEEIPGYGMLYHVWLNETGAVVPVIMSDGLQFTPTNWESPCLPKSAAELVEQAADPAGTRWMDWRGVDAIMIDGLPRALA